MHSSTLPRPALPVSGLVLLIALLAACRAPDVESLQPQLAEPLEAAYRQFNDPAMATHETSCDTAPALAQALEGWIAMAEGNQLHPRFAVEIGQARQRVAAIHARCPDATATAAPRRGHDTRPPKAADAPDVRPAITPATLDAYARGLDREIALMRATGTPFVSLSKYDAEAAQVAAAAGLPLPEYRALRHDVHKVLYELMLHGRYAGPEGRGRLARLEPHKREHAEEVLARDPYASLSGVERDAMRSRLDRLQPQYAGYMQLAIVAD